MWPGRCIRRTSSTTSPPLSTRCWIPYAAHSRILTSSVVMHGGLRPPVDRRSPRLLTELCCASRFVLACGVQRALIALAYPPEGRGAVRQNPLQLDDDDDDDDDPDVQQRQQQRQQECDDAKRPPQADPAGRLQQSASSIGKKDALAKASTGAAAATKNNEGDGLTKVSLVWTASHGFAKTAAVFAHPTLLSLSHPPLRSLFPPAGPAGPARGPHSARGASGRLRQALCMTHTNRTVSPLPPSTSHRPSTHHTLSSLLSL